MDSQVRKLNRDLVIGWLIIVGILFVSYCGEVIKGERTVLYLCIFMIATALPAFFCWYLYWKKPERMDLRYYIVVGYFIMYLFVMLTGSTSMVFSYILPMLSFLVLYHQPNLILFTGIASFLVNIISILHKFSDGEMGLANSKDAEIQLALLFLCFGGSYVATRLYDEITKQNTDYVKMLDEKNIQIQKMSLQTIATIANTIDAKDEYTRGHSRRVSEYSAAIARELGKSEQEIQDICSIALLHDIGKIGVPDSVLNKPGKLTQEEYQLMKQHTVIGADILKDIGMLKDIDIGAKYHHERYDGKGYPDGLKGEEIPPVARIIAFADAYDAMTSNRVYRKHLSDEKVLEELKKGKGTQFDPKAVQALITLIEEHRLENIRPEDAKEEMDDVSTILSRVMEHQEEQAAEKRIMDELTGVYNRSYGQKILQEAAERKSGCLILLDVDHFRTVNEQAGFVTGDIFLKMIAAAMKNISLNIIVVRFGGDEFAAFSPDINTNEAATAAMECFMREVAQMAAAQNETELLSVSVGVLTVKEKNYKNFDEMLLKADKALYVAKMNGGSQYFCYQDTPPEKREYAGADLKQLKQLMEQENDWQKQIEDVCPEMENISELLKQSESGETRTLQLLLFTMSENNENVTVEERERVMTLLERAIVLSIRNEDISIKYSSTQRLVLLNVQQSEEAKVIVDKIMKEFFKMYDKKEVSVYYDMEEITLEA